MKKIIISFMLFGAISFSSFARDTNESSSSMITKVESSFLMKVNGKTLICGLSGDVINEDGEVVGRWNSSCVHKNPTIIINFNDGTRWIIPLQY